MTADEINALPQKARDFIHALEANADPAGMVRENILTREENEQLRASLAEYAKQNARLSNRIAKLELMR